MFLLYHLDSTKQLTSSDVSLIFLHGIRLDFSFAAYLSLLPFIASIIFSLGEKFYSATFVRYYTYTFIILISILLSADLELYTFWGYRLDATPLQYLNTPSEIVASVAIAPIGLLVTITVAISLLFIWLFHRYYDLRKFSRVQNKWAVAGISLFFAALLVLPLRGGIQQIPINQSVAYFSNKPYANHAGLNMPWNLMHSLLKYNKQSKNPYQYMSYEEAAQRVQALYAPTSDSALQILSVQKPNVLFIILESYTAKFVESLGGEKGVTPNLNKLAAEGINFTNMYASGDRSEKGMVALLSGYPVQTTTSIIKTPKKTEKLPQLSQVFKQQGYHTSYYYGGELEFANIKSYLLNGGYGRLIDKYDFPSSSYNSKWGAHDHVLFDKVLQDLKKQDEPFFTTVYTLSSHEPFEIPIDPKFPGKDNEALFRNSVYYTDWALGRFIEEAKKQHWWQNTLVILVADHGHPLPGNDATHQTSKFRIPFIITGGAVKENGLKINTIGSQTDIATTLLAQLNLPKESFKWGRNLLAPIADPFAFYVFNDGFGFVTEQGELTVSNLSKKIITQDNGVTEEQLKNGQAYMQYSFEDFIKK